MFDLKPSKLASSFELQPRSYEDARGKLIKVFHEQAFAAQGLENQLCGKKLLSLLQKRGQRYAHSIASNGSRKNGVLRGG
jgi:hypothetical protein